MDICGQAAITQNNLIHFKAPLELFHQLETSLAQNRNNGFAVLSLYSNIVKLQYVFWDAAL